MPTLIKKGQDVATMTDQEEQAHLMKDSENSSLAGKEPVDEESSATDKKGSSKCNYKVFWAVIVLLAIVAAIIAAFILTGTWEIGSKADDSDDLSEELLANNTNETISNLTPNNATLNPTAEPTVDPTNTPTSDLTVNFTIFNATIEPTVEPTVIMNNDSTLEATNSSASEPSWESTKTPTSKPTFDPTEAPTGSPTSNPTLIPTVATPEQTDEPTAEVIVPDSDSTGERRLIFNPETTPNVFLVILNCTGLSEAEFNTPEVDEFLRVSYTSKKLKDEFTFDSLMTGKVTPIGALEAAVEPNGKAQQLTGGPTWAERIRLRGYINYYYGNFKTESWPYAPLERGWDFFHGSIDKAGENDLKLGVTSNVEIVQQVRSRLLLIEDEMWSITVSLSMPDSPSIESYRKTTAINDDCSRYVEAESNYEVGVRCQWSKEYDKDFGILLETLKVADLWKSTAVVLVLLGEQEITLSIGGGALRTKHLSIEIDDLRSMSDILRTILAPRGFSDSELSGSKFNKFPGKAGYK